jgi:uncharacterized membrane protein
VPVNLVVTPPPDFTVTASPSSASATAGVAVSYSITVGSVAGFTGNVDLSLSGLSPSQAGWTFAPSTISGGAGTSVLTVTSAASLAPGTYGLTITATSGAVSHTTSVNLVVAPPPDFSLTASPTSASTTPGASASYTVTVAPMNGFSGTVNLSLAGLSASQGSWTFAPSTVSGGSGASALTVTTASSLAAGTYALTITGTSGALSHTFAVSLVVARDFTVALSPSSLSLARGRSGTYMVTLGSLGGFSGSVSLSVAGLPSGATATFSRNPASAPGTSSMTVRTTGFTTRGTFTLKVTAKSGSLVHQSTATLVVT